MFESPWPISRFYVQTIQKFNERAINPLNFDCPYANFEADDEHATIPET